MSFANARSRARRLAPRRMPEPLEARLLLAALDACDEGPAADFAPLAAIDSGSLYHAADAGSTFGTATDLGRLSGSRSLPGSVGGSDPSDVVRFSLAGQSQVQLALSGLRSDIDLYLYDARGRLLAISNRPSALPEAILRTLAAGDYYLAIVPWRRAASSYVLTVGAVALPPPVAPPAAPTPPVSNPPASSPVAALPSVPYFGGANEWNLNAVNAPESWSASYTGEGVVVAVVDTGVDLDHPDLVSQLWVNAGEIPGNGLDDDHNGFVDDVSGWDFAGGDNRPDDGNGHGTHVAGTIAAANNGFGATGVAPGATIMPVRVLGNNGSGTSSAVAAGIRYAAANGADIINLSLGGGFSSVIQAAIQFAEQLGVLVVAAAGNESAAAPGYPARFSAALSNVISVGAYASSGALAGFSNDVGTSGAVQVDAPGVGVYSTYVGGGYARLSGTSMAAPHVAGLAALALSANRGLTPGQLRAVIVAGANVAVAGSDARGGINAALTVARAAAGQIAASVAAAGATSGGIGVGALAARSWLVPADAPATAPRLATGAGPAAEHTSPKGRDRLVDVRPQQADDQAARRVAFCELLFQPDSDRAEDPSESAFAWLDEVSAGPLAEV